MHGLPALAAAFALGLVCADRLPLAGAPCWWAAAAGLAVAASVRRPALRRGALLAATALVGAASLAAPLERARRAPDAPQERTLEATVEAVDPRLDGMRIDAVDAVAVDGGGPLPARLRLYGRTDPRFPSALQEPFPGERWRVRARLRQPTALRNPGRPDRTRALARRGVGAVGSIVHPTLAVRVGTEGEGALRRLHRWRGRTAERLARAGPGGALLAALGLGDRRALGPEAREAFTRLGLAHLLAVSGLHLSLFGVGAYLLARRLLARWARFAARGDPRRAALAPALAAATAYAAAAGFGLPLQRAWILLLAAALASAATRARRARDPLALAALVVLARAPHALFEPGFQLSFGATAALLGAGAPVSTAEPAIGPVARAGRFGVGLLHASSAALLATTPLVAIHFGRVAPIGLAANLLAIPATGFVLLPSAALAVAAASAGGVAAGAVLAGAERVAGLALAAVGAAAARVGEVPAASSPPAIVLAAALALAALAIRSGSLPRMAAALVAQTALLAFAPPTPIAPPVPRAVFLDVGQGDATLVQGRRGVLLMDAGPRTPFGFDAGRAAVVPALRALGVARIDRLAVSHADLDHRGGARAVLEAFPVGAVWLPRGAADDAGFAPLRATAGARGVPVVERGAGDAAERLGDLRVSFVWPSPDLAAADRNGASLVLHVAVAGRSLLLPGDVGGAAERALAAAAAPLAADLLLLPHHGSRTSASAALLDAVHPRHAVASAPCHGRFEMPHAEVRARLEARGIPLHWTGRDGAIVVGLAPRLRVRAWGEPFAGCAGLPRSGKNPPDLPVFPRETR